MASIMRLGSVGRWVWLAVGIAVFAHSMLTGGGLAGMLMSWQLEHFNAIDPGYTYLLLFLALVLPPGVALIPRRRSPPRARTREPIELRMKRDGRRMLAAGLALWVADGCALLYSFSLPDLASAPTVIKLDALPASAKVPESNAILIGKPQRRLELGFGESVQSSRWSSSESGRRILPLTSSGWKPGQPIRFLLDIGGPWADQLSPLAGEHGESTELSKTTPGLLFRNSVPPYLRAAIRRRGLILSADAMLHSGDPDVGRMSYQVFAGVTSFVALMLVLFGVLYIYKPALDRRRGV